MKKYLLFISLLAIIALTLTIRPEPVIVEVPVIHAVKVEVEKPIIIEREVEVEKIIEKSVYVDKIVYTQQTDWREFDSLTEFTGWVQDRLPVLWGIGDHVADCDDYAEHLQREGYKEGYLIRCHPVENGRVFGQTVSNWRDPHMGNLVRIGNEIYFVEPQPEYFRTVYICPRD